MATRKRIFAAIVAGGFALSGLAACSSDDDGANGGDGDKGSVYFLNWKPESEQVYQEIAKAYTEEIGRASCRERV